MTKKEFDKVGWNSSIRVDCPDGENKRVLSVDFEDNTVYVELALKLPSWYEYKELEVCSEEKQRRLEKESKAKQKEEAKKPKSFVSPKPKKKLAKATAKELRKLVEEKIQEPLKIKKNASYYRKKKLGLL